MRRRGLDADREDGLCVPDAAFYLEHRGDVEVLASNGLAGWPHRYGSARRAGRRRGALLLARAPARRTGIDPAFHLTLTLSEVADERGAIKTLPLISSRNASASSGTL